MKMNSEQAFEMYILLQQARDALYNARNKELTKYGLSPRESAILHAVYSIGEDANPTIIGRWIYRKPHTVTSILQRMQKKGLVKLNKDKLVKNVVRISLTKEGEKVYKATLKRKSVVNTFSSLPDEHLEQLKADLVVVRDKSLKQTGDTIHRKFP